MINLIDRAPTPVTRRGCYRWYDDIRRDRTRVQFAIEQGKKGLHIGNCGLCDISERSKKAKLWIYIGVKRLWDKGFGREALEQLMSFGFEQLGLNRIYLYVVEDNSRAKRFYKAAGFKREGLFRQDTFLEGRFKNTIYYSMLKKEFEKRKYHGTETQR